MVQQQRGIYKRKDNRYEARFIKGRDENGKSIYGSVYAHSHEEALVKLEKAKQAHGQKVNQRMQQTIPTVLRSYLESIRGQIKASSYGTYNVLLEKHIASYFSEIKCDDLSPAIVQNFVNKQFESGLSTRSIETILIFLKKGLDTVFPSTYEVKFPKYIGRKLEVLAPDEQNRLEDTAKDSDATDYVGIMLCLYTGIKPGELCGLMWSDIDFEKKLLHIRRTALRIKTPGGDTKTFLPVNRSAQRSIHLQGLLFCC